MTKYRKKPVVVDAVKFEDTAEALAAISELAPDKLMVVSYRSRPLTMSIPTEEGVMTATEGDYIVKGVKGEIYPCKADIFEQTYEKEQETTGPSFEDWQKQLRRIHQRPLSEVLRGGNTQS